MKLNGAKNKIYHLLVNKYHRFTVLCATRPSKSYLEFYYITQCVFQTLFKIFSTCTLHYMFRSIFVIIRCLKLWMKTAVLPFCESNIQCVVPSTLSYICNTLSVYLFKTYGNIPDDYLFMYLLYGALYLFLLCCVSRESRQRVFAKLDSVCFLYCVCVCRYLLFNSCNVANIVL
jgi:hypothetical protein